MRLFSLLFAERELMRKFINLKNSGISGKSVIPMVIGTGCAIPGIMACRTIRNERERRATAMLTPFMPCGAKLPVGVRTADVKVWKRVATVIRKKWFVNEKLNELFFSLSSVILKDSSLLYQLLRRCITASMGLLLKGNRCRWHSGRNAWVLYFLI